MPTFPRVQRKQYSSYFQEEEMRNSGDAKYAHLNEDLHIYIEIHAYPVEAQGRFAHVLNELKKFLDPNHPVSFARKSSYL